MTYEHSASVYDAIYTAMKDYEAETRRIVALIGQHARIPVTSLLDVACGTGLHDQYLTRHYHVAGIDLSPHMLGVARANHPKISFDLGDMRTFERPDRVEAIICLFSAVGHLGSVEELNRTVANFADHLMPGGVILIEPWLLPGTWQEGRTGLDLGTAPGLQVARRSSSHRFGDTILLVLEHWVDRGDGIESFTDYHLEMMFSHDDFERAFAKAGLNGRYDPAGISPNGRGIFIATKPLV